MDIRRLLVVCDTINSEGGLPALRPVTRVAACAVIRNPLAGAARDDLGEIVPFGAGTGRSPGAQGARRCCRTRRSPTARRRSSGSTATSSMPLRSSIRAWASRCARRSAAARRSFRPTSRLPPPAPRSTYRSADRDDVWLFDHIDTITVVVPDAPRPAEIVVVVALSDGGRPRPRIDKDGARPSA